MIKHAQTIGFSSSSLAIYPCGNKENGAKPSVYTSKASRHGVVETASANCQWCHAMASYSDEDQPPSEADDFIPSISCQTLLQ